MALAYKKALVTVALACSVLHHLGLLPNGLGSAPSQTRWTDWFDLALPWLVLAPAAVALQAGEARMRVWVLFGLGCVAYASGHGIHLAANSVGNASPGPTAHLWDEVVGHHIWYAGVALVVAALSDTMTSRERPPWWGYVLSLTVGLTWASNAVGGGTEVLGVIVATCAVVFGWRHRRSLAAVLVVGFAPAVCFLVVASLPG